MKKTLRMILSLCLVAAMCLAAGCASKTTGQVSPSPSVVPSASPTVQATATPTAEPTATAKPAAFPVTIKDIMDTQVTIDKEPQRIVSLAASCTEILFALGAGDRVVAVDAYSNYPESVSTLPKAGDFSGPSIETIVSLNPDLVVAGNGLQKESIDKLRELGITVIAMEARTYDQIAKTIELMGKVVGKSDEAAAINTQLQAKQTEIADKVKDAAKPKVYYAMSYGENGNWTSGPGSFINTMIEFAGGTPVTANADNAWLEYNMEQLIKDDPDVIITSPDMKDGLMAADGYKDLRAVKEGKVYAINADILSRPAPRIADALTEIAKALHPDLFQ